jgi:hypothetical protein
MSSSTHSVHVPTATRPDRGTATRPPHGPDRVVRLTRRGRLVVALTVAVAVMFLFAMRGDPAVSTSVVHHQQTSTIVVTPGETVWDIARTMSAGSDPRPMVAQIEALNSLPDAGSIRVGQPLLVPAP